MQANQSNAEAGAETLNVRKDAPIILTDDYIAEVLGSGKLNVDMLDVALLLPIYSRKEVLFPISPTVKSK